MSRGCRWLGILLAVGTLGGAELPAVPLGTAITYQGQLKQSGVPYGGTADLTFSLYSAPAAGGQIVAGPVTLSNVSVVNGLFTVQIDFGAAAFSGDARWLEIQVRTPAGSGSYTTLSPRQPITATPQASFAAGPWVTGGSNLSYTAGNVGIGTTSPSSLLTIGSAPTGGSLNVVGSSTIYPYILLTDSRSGGLWYGFYSGASAPGNLDVVGDGVFRLTINSSGNIGIGTFTPTARLDVRGAIRLGNSGEYLAPAGEENLRIIRGVVNAAGGIIVGSGFTVTHTATGKYTVSFNLAFPAPPCISATADGGGANRNAMTNGVLGTFANIETLNPATGAYADTPFHFMAIGPR